MFTYFFQMLEYNDKYVKMRNGLKMPLVGLGSWLVRTKLVIKCNIRNTHGLYELRLKHFTVKTSFMSN